MLVPRNVLQKPHLHTCIPSVGIHYRDLSRKAKTILQNNYIFNNINVKRHGTYMAVIGSIYFIQMQSGGT